MSLSKSRGTALVGVTVLLTTVLSAGCESKSTTTAAPAPQPTASANGQFLSRAEVVRQLPGALRNFDGTYPGDAATSDVLWRLDAGFTRVPPPKNGKLEWFERGAAESAVLMDWLCTWEREYLTAHKHGDEASADRAVAQLATFHDREYAKKYVEDPDRSWEREVLDPARNGDARSIEAEFNTSCR